MARLFVWQLSRLAIYTNTKSLYGILVAHKRYLPSVLNETPTCNNKIRVLREKFHKSWASRIYEANVAMTTRIKSLRYFIVAQRTRKNAWLVGKKKRTREETNKKLTCRYDEWTRVTALLHFHPFSLEIHYSERETLLILFSLVHQTNQKIRFVYILIRLRLS